MIILVFLYYFIVYLYDTFVLSPALHNTSHLWHDIACLCWKCR